MKDSLQNSPADQILNIQKKKKIFLLREAAKKIVSDLRKRSPFFSEALNTEIFVTKKYLQHILYTKKRDDETEEKLLISAFVDIGIKEGKLFSSRHEENGIFHELHYSLKQEKIGIIIIESKGDFFVISAFLKHKKNTLSDGPFHYHKP